MIRKEQIDRSGLSGFGQFAELAGQWRPDEAKDNAKQKFATEPLVQREGDRVYAASNL